MQIYKTKKNGANIMDSFMLNKWFVILRRRFLGLGGFDLCQ